MINKPTLALVAIGAGLLLTSTIHAASNIPTPPLPTSSGNASISSSEPNTALPGSDQVVTTDAAMDPNASQPTEAEKEKMRELAEKIKSLSPQQNNDPKMYPAVEPPVNK